MTELRVSHLIDEADELLDNKFHVGSYCLFMNTDDIQDILSKIRAILPEEIKTAEMILKRRDDIYMEAQSKADRILSEAKASAAKILSESEMMRLARERIMKIQDQVKESCDEMKNKAAEEAEEMRKSAYKEAMETREGAKAFAEEMLMNLEHNIDRVHRHIRNCQDLLNQKKEQRTRAPQQDNGSIPNRVNAEQK
jgi:hypothetical protein